MGSYINQAPGSANSVSITLQAYDSTGALVSGNLVVPSLQDVTISNANDVFTWEQLDSSAKLKVATLAVNQITTNIVVDDASFFGNASATSGSAGKLGIIGMSRAKTKVAFSVNFGTRTLSGSAYISGLAPKITAAQPVWLTPLTLDVTGEYSNT
jgi:hypothetical protein